METENSKRFRVTLPSASGLYNVLSIVGVNTITSVFSYFTLTLSLTHSLRFSVTNIKKSLFLTLKETFSY